MKNVLNLLFRWLDKIGKDKYQHFALGSFLALIVFVVAFTLVKFIGHGAARRLDRLGRFGGCLLTLL